MNKLDFDAVNQALNPDVVVPQWLPGGHRRGNEYVVANPTRNDKNPGSFTINLAKGVWKDYATSEGGSDMVSLYAYLFHNNDQGEAVKELAQNSGVKIGDPVTREQAAANNVVRLNEPVFEPIMPVPFAATEPTFWHPGYGEPVARWAYTDTDGEVLLYVCRFEPPGERKQIVPRSWGVDPKDGKAKWMWRGIKGKGKRPLLYADRLAARPDADVIVCEGESTADAAQELFGDAVVCTTWLGGVETADRASIKLLEGRRVILWPDFDSQTYKDNHPHAGELMPRHEQPGVRAMMAIAQALKGHAREIIMVGYTPGGEFDSGWDLKDAQTEGWDTVRVAAYMAKNSGDPWHIAGARAPAPPAPPAPPPAPGASPPAPEPEPPRVPLDATVNPFGWAHMGDKGQPMNTVENLAYMLDEYGITARYNVISKDVEIKIPGMSFSQDNCMAACLATIGSMCVRNRLARSELGEYMTLLADANPYNAAAEWIDSKPWDQQDRMGALAETLDPVDRELATALLRRWMIGAVGCVYEPAGMSMQGVLVLQGPQNSGKTTWFWSLTNKNRALAREGVTLNPSDKDSVKGAISYWLSELGELDATFRKADIAQMKAFLTKDMDELRLPYARASSRFPRRTAFVGTVNPKHYLHDDTGNRRYWTVRHGPGLKGIHDVDMQQAWAQAKTLWAAGEQHRLTREELDRLNEVNEEHQEPNTIEELILSRFDWNNPTRSSLLTASEVLVVIGFDKPNNKQAKDAGVVLRKLTGGDPHKSHGRMVFKMPAAHTRAVNGLGGVQKTFDHDDEARPF